MAEDIDIGKQESAVQAYLRTTRQSGYKSISEYHRQIFRNFSYSDINKYGATETEQVYNFLIERGVLYEQGGDLTFLF